MGGGGVARKSRICNVASSSARLLSAYPAAARNLRREIRSFKKLGSAENNHESATTNCFRCALGSLKSKAAAKK